MSSIPAHTAMRARESGAVRPVDVAFFLGSERGLDRDQVLSVAIADLESMGLHAGAHEAALNLWDMVSTRHEEFVAALDSLTGENQENQQPQRSLRPLQAPEDSGTERP